MPFFAIDTGVTHDLIIIIASIPNTRILKKYTILFEHVVCEEVQIYGDVRLRKTNGS